jgi:cell division protein FtsW
MKDRNILFYTVLLLTSIGVIMVFSATGIYADTEYQSTFFFLKKELLWLLIGLISMAAAYKINLNVLWKNAPFIFTVALVLVCLTHSPFGVKIGGAARWIRFGFFNLQPSEFLKVGLVCMIAAYLGGSPLIAREFVRGFLFTLFLIGISVAPVITQPDFGTSLMLASVGCLMLLIAGARFKYMGAVVLSAIPVIYYFIVFYPYRMRRVIAFLDPWSDPQGKGFQIVQSFLAIGRGSVTGVGLGESTQKLFYLPAAHTDFIFSILAEELGFVGGTVVIACFIILTITGFVIAMRSKSSFGSLLAFGCTAHISMQALFNIAVVTGSVPTKGIPLPFISFGGSNLVLNLLAIGLIMNVSRQRESQVYEEKKKPELVRQRACKLFISQNKYSKPAWT